MRLVRCPCGCGHVFDADDARVQVFALSPVAVSLLECAPPSFKRGQPVAVRLLAELTGYSETHVRRGLFELQRAGYVARIPFGKRGRSQFVGVPTMILAESPLLLAA